MMKCVFLLLLAFACFAEELDVQDVVEESGLPDEMIGASETYTPPPFKGNHYLFEPFSGENDLDFWVKSQDEKYSGEWTVDVPTSGDGIAAVPIGFPADKALIAITKAQHLGLSKAFSSLTVSQDKDLVIQYEVKLQEGLECGGAYVKLLGEEASKNLEGLKDDTPYIIMFGPDKCGYDSKVHFIFRHKNPVSGEWAEKHMTDRPTVPADKLSHLYTLVVRPDNTFEMFIDQESARKGDLASEEDFDPPVNPPREIDDPEDLKPEDWVDDEQMEDPEATKPEDWDEDAPRMIADPDAVMPEGWLEDEPLMINDLEAVKPEDWDDDEDGEWVSAQIPNPECEAVGCGTWKPEMIHNPDYKGPWSPPMIPNPAYKGEWKPRLIPNPHYFVDEHPALFPPIGALALELWTMTSSILFDNFLVTDDFAAAEAYGAQTWKLRFTEEKKLDAEAKEASQKEREGEVTFMDQMWIYWVQFWNLMMLTWEEHPGVILGMGMAFLMALVLLCWPKKAAAKVDPKKDEDEDEHADETEEALKEETSARKRK